MNKAVKTNTRYFKNLQKYGKAGANYKECVYKINRLKSKSVSKLPTIEPRKKTIEDLEILSKKYLDHYVKNVSPKALELQEKINKIRERLQRYIDEYIFIHNLKTPRAKQLYLEFASNSNPYEISSLSMADKIPTYENLYFQDFSPIITKSFFNGPPINYEYYEDSGYPSQDNYIRNTINLGHYLNYRNKKDDDYIWEILDQGLTGYSDMIDGLNFEFQLLANVICETLDGYKFEDMSLDKLSSKLLEIDDSKIIYRDWARIDLRQLLINSFNSFLHYTRAGQGDYEPTLINDRVYYGDEDIEFNIYYKSYETIKELLGGQNA